jgi:hypothetical protein
MSLDNRPRVNPSAGTSAAANHQIEPPQERREIGVAFGTRSRKPIDARRRRAPTTGSLGPLLLLACSTGAKGASQSLPAHELPGRRATHALTFEVAGTHDLFAEQLLQPAGLVPGAPEARCSVGPSRAGTRCLALRLVIHSSTRRPSRTTRRAVVLALMGCAARRPLVHLTPPWTFGQGWTHAGGWRLRKQMT